jgi:CDP-glycerol glycerophosphotransferase (TagB/SpsB family)
MHNHLGFDYKYLEVTGYARFDGLKDNSKGEKEIMIMPTLGAGMIDLTVKTFQESTLLKNLSTLFYNKELGSFLERKKYIIKLILHPSMNKYFKYIKTNSKNIVILKPGAESIDQMLCNAKLLITDYSSIAWDMLYMGKEVIFYDFSDAERNFNSYINLDTKMPGYKAKNIEDLVSLIASEEENNFKIPEKFEKEIGKYFAFNDSNNSQRIWSAISKHNL